MTVRVQRGSVGPVRRRAVLAASLALTPLPVANAYGSARDVHTRAAQYQAASVAASRAALDRARANAPFVPAPPVPMNIVKGYAPGESQTEMSNAGYDHRTNTLYYQGKLDPASKAHDTGHAFDWQVLTDGDRRYFQRTMHAPPGEWRSGTGVSGGTHSPSEWFADYYQAAALHLDPMRQNEASYTRIGPVRLKRFEAALARLAKRQHLQQYH